MVKKTKIKQRPRRLFKDDKLGKYFYLIDGKKKYIKTGDITSEKQIARINIKNIMPVKVIRKAIRPRTSIKPITNQQVVSKLAPISQNLTDKKYDIYKIKDNENFEKRLTKVEEKQKLEDTKKAEIEKATEEVKKGKKKGLFSNLFKPTKAPKATDASVIAKERLDTEKQILKDAEQQRIQAEKDKQDKNAVNKGFVETNPDPDEEDEGDISTEPTGIFGKVGQLFTGKNLKT